LSGKFYRLKEAAVLILLAAVLLAVPAVSAQKALPAQAQAGEQSGAPEKDSFIKWVDFNVTYLAMKKALTLDIESHRKGGNLSWVDLLACLGAKYGGKFDRYKSADMDVFAKKLETQSLQEATKGLNSFAYYREAYGAALGGLTGTYLENGQEKYGLTAFSPIAKGFPYEEYDDFGATRTYGFSRPHLGHDMMAATGTPVIAVESGIVEALGWNQYGGWRIGIRSFDSKRYYYYAHLRQNRPYAAGLCLGKTVEAGDVIGYVGRTGYSAKENVNNIRVSHLHFGLQLIFDESQKESNDEIWIDCYALTKLLRQHRSAVVRDPVTKEYSRAAA
jgi:murein DD-endopeptidase MepM/ murein hydrolase activator NlpD